MAGKKTVLFLALIFAVMFTTGAGAEGPGDNELHLLKDCRTQSLVMTGDPAALHKVFIGFLSRPGAREEALVRGAGGRVKYTYHIVPAMAATLPEAAVTALAKNPAVAYIEPDAEVYAIDAELDNAWGVKQIGAGAVQADGNKGTGARVAVIDTGVDYNHSDLQGRYAGGWDFVNNDADPMDDNGHGTHVAGTIAANDNGAGVVGVAPEARLYALKVLDSQGSGTFSDVIKALEWATDQGIQVTNNSYGSDAPPTDTVNNVTAEMAFDNSYNAGMLHVAAAGNSGFFTGLFPPGDVVGYPARFGSVIAVAATDGGNTVAWFSSTGPAVELAAPGVNINSTLPGNGYGINTGTSMASPHVAGTAALIITSGISDSDGDGFVNDEVRQRLDSTADDMGDTGRDWLYGYGLVNAAQAASSSGTPAPAVNVSVLTDKDYYISGTDTPAVLTAVVTDEHGDAVSGLAPGAFDTTIDGAAFYAGLTETARAGSYTGGLAVSALPDGTHAVGVTANDPVRGVSGSGSAVFGTGPLLATGVSVKSISYGMQGKKIKTLRITIAVADNLGGPVANAYITVNLNLNGAPYAFGYGYTLADGNITFTKDNPPTGCYTTDVLSVTAPSGLAWDGATPANSYCNNRKNR